MSAAPSAIPGEPVRPALPEIVSPESTSRDGLPLDEAVPPPVVPYLTESEMRAIDAELDASIAMRGTPNGGAFTFEDLVMQRLRATPDVLKATLLLTHEPKTFRALTVTASPRWNALLTLAGFPSAPAPAVSLAALRFCLEDTRTQIADSEAEAKARGLTAPTDTERARRRLAAANLLIKSPDDGRRNLAIKILRHMQAGRLL